MVPCELLNNVAVLLLEIGETEQAQEVLVEAKSNCDQLIKT